MERMRLGLWSHESWHSALFLVLGTWCRTKSSSSPWEAVYQKYINHRISVMVFFFRFPLLLVQLHIVRKTKLFLRNRLRGTALFEEKEITAKGVSENQPDVRWVNEADVGWKRSCRAAIKKMLWRTRVIFLLSVWQQKMVILWGHGNVCSMDMVFLAITCT